IGLNSALTVPTAGGAARSPCDIAETGRSTAAVKMTAPSEKYLCIIRPVFLCDRWAASCKQATSVAGAFPKPTTSHQTRSMRKAATLHDQSKWIHLANLDNAT